MKPGYRFGAPWALSLRLMTILSIVILGGMALIGLTAEPIDTWLWPLAMVVLPLGVLVIAAFFMILGYELTPDEILIRRPGWASRVSLKGLQSVEVDPEAMRRSLRTFGNGGLFCFAGRFRNRKLGPYRAWATDPKSAVVLKFADRVVVVTPDEPRKFAARVRTVNQGS